MNEECCKKEDCCKSKSNGCGAAGCGTYGLAFIGALVYFIQNAGSFTQGLVGFFKALVWPAILVYELLKFLIK